MPRASAFDFNNAAPAAPATTSGRSWSPYQTAIFDALRSGVSSLCVTAVAGSGKTTTIVEGCNVVRETHGVDPLFLAFNKSIADELKSRGVNGATLHSCGFRAWAASQGRRVEIDKDKTFKLVREAVSNSFALRKMEGDIRKLVGYAKQYGMVPGSADYNEGHYSAFGVTDDTAEEWVRIAAHHDIDLPERELFEAVTVAKDVLRQSLEMGHIIDFDDMLYMPVVFGVSMAAPPWVFVDEAQDVSGIQRAMLAMMVRPGKGRIVAVGDRAQAIYGFRGADASSIDNIVNQFGCAELPLSITYRCAKRVVDEARMLVPHIEAAPNAKDGEVIDAGVFSSRELTGSDMIVCRNTRPLIETAFRLIGAGVPATVMGRDIGDGLAKTLAALPIIRDATLIERVDAWEEKVVRGAEKRNDEAKVQRTKDRAECLRVIIENIRATSPEAVKSHITKIFADDAPNRVKLATVHKSKGLEADRVFILKRSLMPSPWAMQPWQRVQEANLEYVAITRAKSSLVMVEDFR
ncbi:AAA domain containing protein [uncultured Caudovirales phage]|uniref:DNA 3'-5' helicase n=1 Tax=uncultured Caudovirales phage TaxID=2100421 RepID=A0A6J5M9R1_9CAUD|nr:AAA domain containing protein [uncultured Caudovirales phage]